MEINLDDSDITSGEHHQAYWLISVKAARDTRCLFDTSPAAAGTGRTSPVNTNTATADRDGFMFQLSFS